MRQVGSDHDVPPPRPRKHNSADGDSPSHAADVPTQFVLGGEDEVNVRMDGEKAQQDDGREGEEHNLDADSTFGVQSMEESMVASTTGRVPAAYEQGDISQVARPETPRRRSTIRAFQARRDESLSGLSAVSGLSSHASSPEGRRAPKRVHEDVHNQISQPMTPLSRASPVLHAGEYGSIRSLSVRSLRHPEDELDGGSQVVFSSGEEDNLENEQLATSDGPLSALQLVMPSLTLPSRRPFTGRGKQLGKLKLLFAGPSGSGKTSLIKSVVQTCEDIVHIDSPGSPPASQKAARSRGKQRTMSASTRQITEIAGSTRPYPNWWSQLDGSQILRRRHSAGEEVLERNVTFIDTPGYDAGSSMLEGMELVLRHVETHMQQAMTPATMSDDDLIGVLGGAGGTHIDAVLYLLPAQPTPLDFEFLQQLARLTNVIPLLGKIDLLQTATKTRARSHILEQVGASNIPLLTLPDGFPRLFDVCSSPSSGLESMDASLLMASNYVNPLHESDLPKLVEYLFDPTHASFLKHSAAKKLIAWRKTPGTGSLVQIPSPLHTNLFAPTLPLSSNASTGGHRGATSPLLSPTTAALTYTSARLSDHKAREERMAQINLGNWAESLRRNLAAERARYESIANSEREKWLKERLQECVFDSQIVQSEKVMALGAHRTRFTDLCLEAKRKGTAGAGARGQTGGLFGVLGGGQMDAADPFAIMLWRGRALTALQVVGGLSVLSAVALWVTREWGLDWEWLDRSGLGRLLSAVGLGNPVGPDGPGRTAQHW